jgi:hypothetical protein
MIDEPILKPTGERFPDPDTLRRSTMEGFEGSVLDERRVAAAEGDTAGDTGGFERLRLRADEAVVFPDRGSLRGCLEFGTVTAIAKPDTVFASRRRGRTLLWTASAAAAVVALALLVNLPQPVDRVTSTGSVTGKVDAVGPSANSLTDNAATYPVAEPVEAANPAPAIPAAKAPTTQARTTRHFDKPDAPRHIDASRPDTPTPQIFAPPPASLIATGHQLIASRGHIVLELSAPLQPATGAAQPAAVERLMEQLAGASLPQLERPALSRLLMPIDRTAGSGMATLSRLLGRETTIIKEYDSSGHLTHYAVYTPNSMIRRNYSNQ